MKYVESISDFFKQPDWIKNLLLAGVCFLIPIVGPIVVMGWLVTGFWGRRDHAPETFPNFDFAQFSKYLERGLWPFLVVLAASVVVVPVAWIVVLIPMLILGALFSGGEGGAVSSILGLIVGLIGFALYIGAVLFIMLVIKPLNIRASLTQDFMKSFDFAFVKQFISLTWKESLLSSAFLVAASMILMPLGMVVLCVGMYAAAALVYFAWAHMDKQIYALYLARGGAPVEVSPKLSDEPPVLV